MTGDAGSGGVVLLAGPGESTNMVFNGLRRRVPVRGVIVERRVGRRALVRRRMRRHGIGRTIGQIAFRALIVPLLRRSSRRRRAELVRTVSLDLTPIPDDLVRRVRSVNDVETAGILAELRPAVVVVNGTRILSHALLTMFPLVTFLNLHAGITPIYRGVHGAYWARAQGDAANCGVTVHRVDPGIDTGPIVFQATISPTREDDFTTYPLLQLGAGIPLLTDAVIAALAGALPTRPTPAGASRLWSHPTAFEYVRHRLRGVR
jgi:folate-dependent phosphoribosylglycinamide formyltransferase PurN